MAEKQKFQVPEGYEAPEPTEGADLPDGFVYKLVPTSTGSGRNKVEYSVFVPQAQSLAAWRAKFEADGHNPDDVILGIMNGASEQNGKQGQKGGVRDAAATGEYTRGSGDEAEKFEGEDAVTAAILDHQAGSVGYFIGAPRQTDGPTKKEKESLGDRVVRTMTTKLGRTPTSAELDEALAALM